MSHSGSSTLSLISNQLSPKDIKYNSVLQSLEKIEGPLTRLSLNQDRIDTILDLGCGFGGFAAALGNVFDAERTVGIDKNEERRSVAEGRGLQTYNLDIENEQLPFKDNSVDLVLSFGLFEHFTCYDHALKEISRVLREDGWFWIGVPNLSGWTNRLALLFGYQPRNIEITSSYPVGILPMYDYQKPIGHVHAPTYRALVELLQYYEFSIEITTPLSPYQNSFVTRTIDAVLGRSPSFSRRVAVLCQTHPTDKSR